MLIANLHFSMLLIANSSQAKNLQVTVEITWFEMRVYSWWFTTALIFICWGQKHTRVVSEIKVLSFEEKGKKRLKGVNRGGHYSQFKRSCHSILQNHVIPSFLPLQTFSCPHRNLLSHFSFLFPPPKPNLSLSLVSLPLSLLPNSTAQERILKETINKWRWKFEFASPF